MNSRAIVINIIFMAGNIRTFIEDMPKAELHLHIEGSLEPELIFKIARRNGKRPKYGSAEELRASYEFENLQDFLDIYYEGAGVLVEEEDFYDMTMAYLEKAYSQKVLHAEISFGPQTHMKRGVKFDVVIRGITRATARARQRLGMSTRLIMCFLRDMSAGSAMKTLQEALPYKDRIVAVGLASAEAGNPPSKFKGVFDCARKEGFSAVAHAGEDGPAEYVREALDILKVTRIGHGNISLEDKELVHDLIERKVPLTVCPLSSLKLRIVKDMKSHPLKKMMEKGIIATVNSDNPAYCGGYINENYLAAAEAFDLSRTDIYRLARNSFLFSFLPEPEKKEMVARLDEHMEGSGWPAL